MTTTTSTRRPGAGKQTRQRQRALHLVTGLALLVYVYAPGGAGEIYESLVRWVLLPALVATGVAMWQWPAIRRLTRKAGGRP